jgi:hypothetical protein
VRRSLITILAVAAISSWISRAEHASGEGRPRTDWVRTVDGWESRSVLAVASEQPTPELHPGLVAAFQLTASLLALVALPGRAVPVRSASTAMPSRPRPIGGRSLSRKSASAR